MSPISCHKLNTHPDTLIKLFIHSVAYSLSFSCFSLAIAICLIRTRSEEISASIAGRKIHKPYINRAYVGYTRINKLVGRA